MVWGSGKDRSSPEQLTRLPRCQLFVFLGKLGVGFLWWCRRFRKLCMFEIQFCTPTLGICSLLKIAAHRRRTATSGKQRNGTP